MIVQIHYLRANSQPASYSTKLFFLLLHPESHFNDYSVLENLYPLLNYQDTLIIEHLVRYAFCLSIYHEPAT